MIMIWLQPSFHMIFTEHVEHVELHHFDCQHMVAKVSNSGKVYLKLSYFGLMFNLQYQMYCIINK